MLGIARAVGDTGRGVFQAVADFDDLDGEFALLRAMAEVGRRPLSITTLQRPDQPVDAYRRLLDLIDAAAHDGLEVRGQVASRPVGLILGLEGRVHPLVGSPTYQALAARPFDEMVRELGRPEVRDVILAELSDPARDITSRLGPGVRARRAAPLRPVARRGPRPGCGLRRPAGGRGHRDPLRTGHELRRR